MDHDHTGKPAFGDADPDRFFHSRRSCDEKGYGGARRLPECGGAYRGKVGWDRGYDHGEKCQKVL